MSKNKVRELFSTDHAMPISLSEFKSAGWDYYDFLKYISMCEEIQCIKILNPNIKTIDKCRNLSPCAQHAIDWFYEQLDLTAREQKVPIPKGGLTLSESDENAKLITKIRKSPEKFRMEFEQNVLLKHEIHSEKPYDFMTYGELTKKLEELERKEALLEFSFEFQEKESYYEIQEIFQQYADLANQKSEIRSQIRQVRKGLELKKILPKSDEIISLSEAGKTLHVVYGSIYNIFCARESHPMSSATGLIKDVQGNQHKINITYCSKCRMCYISKKRYDTYIEDFKYMLVNFSPIGGDSKTGKMFLSTQSRLRLCGYNVGGKDGLTKAQRQMLLASLMEYHIMEKYKILDQLDFFLGFQGRAIGMENAVRKWKEDKLFVMQYRLGYQPQAVIDEITKYERNKR